MILNSISDTAKCSASQLRILLENIIIIRNAKEDDTLLGPVKQSFWNALPTFLGIDKGIVVRMMFPRISDYNGKKGITTVAGKK